MEREEIEKNRKKEEDRQRNLLEAMTNDELKKSLSEAEERCRSSAELKSAADERVRVLQEDLRTLSEIHAAQILKLTDVHHKYKARIALLETSRRRKTKLTPITMINDRIDQLKDHLGEAEQNPDSSPDEIASRKRKLSTTERSGKKISVKLFGDCADTRRRKPSASSGPPEVVKRSTKHAALKKSSEFFNDVLNINSEGEKYFRVTKFTLECMIDLSKHNFIVNMDGPPSKDETAQEAQMRAVQCALDVFHKQWVYVKEKGLYS